MISLGSGVFETGCDVFRFEIREILQDLFPRHARRKQFKDILDPDAHPPNTGAPATLVGMEGDPLVHRMNIIHDVPAVKVCLRFGVAAVGDRAARPPVFGVRCSVRANPRPESRSRADGGGGAAGIRCSVFGVRCSVFGARCSVIGPSKSTPRVPVPGRRDPSQARSYRRSRAGGGGGPGDANLPSIHS